MTTLKDIINLANVDGGKFFVLDEQGNTKLVILSIEDYQRMLLGKLQKQVEDIEKINKEIIKAQLHEEVLMPLVAVEPEILKHKTSHKFEDLREEVIDLSFDFEEPKTDIDNL